MRRHPTYIRFILILSSHLRLGLPNGLFTSGFPTKTLYTTLFSPISAICSARLIFLDFITQIILCEQYRSLSSSLCSFSSLPFYFVPLRPKYLSQHPILEFSLRYSLIVSDQVSHPYKENKVIVICILMFIFFDELKT